MEPNAISIAKDVAGLLGWPITMMFLWWLTRRGSRNGDVEKSNLKEVANRYERMAQQQIEALKETNKILYEQHGDIIALREKVESNEFCPMVRREFGKED